MPEITATEIAEVLLGIRRKLVKIAAIILSVWIVSFLYISDEIIRKVEKDLLPKGAKIIMTYPLEGLILKLRISLYLGLTAAAPYIIYVGYKVLKERTNLLDNVEIGRSKAFRYLAVGAALFIAGVLYGYCLMLPIFMRFLYGIAVRQGALAYYSISEFVNFVVLMLVVFGFIFEMPLIMCFLVGNGIVSYNTLKKYWRHFVVAFFVIGAAITPPDVFTQLMVAVPMTLFFGLSLLAIRIIYRDRIREESLYQRP